MPSETESFGLAALEAMACEVPVVSSNAGGIPELNIDGVTGFLCNVGDVDCMAEKSIHILSDEKRLLEFKHHAKKRALEFHINNILPKYEKVYDSVIRNAMVL
jgi:glycosyltransferase involved in cell wall biosynthesis